MRPADLLFSQGFGTRRECAAIVANGWLDVEGLGIVDDAERELDAGSQLWFRFRGGERWPHRERALIVLNKPAGYECSLKPSHHASVYSLLPAPLRRRGVQAIGRLDEDTTGVLLFTDDGALVHRLTSPRHHVAKVYEVGCRHAGRCGAGRAAVRRRAAARSRRERSRDGLRGDRRAPASPDPDEGKYHQVKRMIAAVGNRVETLERSAFGAVRIDGLAAGGWRWLDAGVEFPAAPRAAAASPRPARS